ncbi:hypothetical protein K2173_017506 [Erythroxylum novogranatense]|uniref:Uncharacterized protein n=1 Tax=Erythroxylum novogranatense TaxID=1862640 RepID=A0AAV8TKW8_9ROSI|nr:hypothetical protein K2173_017506 [Erythroxylum novogranatense]
MYPNFHDHSSNPGEAMLVSNEKKNADILCPSDFQRSSQLSTASTESGYSAPKYVYQRRKIRKISFACSSGEVATSTKRNGEDCLSVISSNSHLVAVVEQHVTSQLVEGKQGVGDHGSVFQVSIEEPDIFKSDSINGYELLPGDFCKNSKHIIAEVDSINDSCSSSKSNIEHVSDSMRTEIENGECSSTSAMDIDVMPEDLSSKDLCISILKSEGLLDGVWPCKPDLAAEDCSAIIPSRSCKICRRMELVLKMLICDDCEEAFHLSCCSLRMKGMPTDEWLCHSCLKKKHKILKKTSRRSPNIMGARRRSRNSLSARKSHPAALMLRDNEPYVSSVRVGKGFQAEIPDWSPLLNDDVNGIAEPLEMPSSSDPCSSHELATNKPPKVTLVGNWLQCREVLDGGEEGGTVCGKWRRAPLFEVQTDDWECFCSLLWDPTHADCAVPQELETDEVMKQLKYIQMLRPRLEAKEGENQTTQGRPFIWRRQRMSAVYEQKTE